MSKKVFLSGVLIGAGLVVGGVAASKNEKVKEKVNNIKENERVQKATEQVKNASEQVKTQVTKVKESESVKKAVEKSKQLSSDVVNKVKGKKGSVEAPADYAEEITEEEAETDEKVVDETKN